MEKLPVFSETLTVVRCEHHDSVVQPPPCFERPEYVADPFVDGLELSVVEIDERAHLHVKEFVGQRFERNLPAFG